MKKALVSIAFGLVLAAQPALARNEFELRLRHDAHRHAGRVHFDRVIVLPNRGFNRYNGELPGGFDRDVDRSNSGSPSFPYNPVSGEGRGLLDQ